jgi:D-alanyl-D-alanine carboxypeptidase
MIKFFIALLALCISHLAIAAPLTSAQQIEIDRIVADVLKQTKVPSISIAVATDGQLEYAKGYGDQRLNRSLPTTSARYSIASISKQFTAAAILLLVEDGKMSLDDKVAKYLPTLTGADGITVRQLLSHTAGYRDYWPQDFDFADMAKPVTPMGILDRWARAPLDYEPGTKWQYSNTGYVAAGLIAEKVAGEPLFAFQQRRIFKPLGMDVLETDARLQPGDARGTNQYALGPVRATVPTGPGWLFAAGNLAMTPTELSKWNIARLTRSLLKPESWAMQEANAAPADVSFKYGLGVYDGQCSAHRCIEHGGALSGYLSINRVYPDGRAALTVVSSAGFSNATEAIATRIEAVLFGVADETARARTLYAMLASGKIDRAQFTENGNAYFTARALADYRSSLSPLGLPTAVIRRGKPGLRGGLTSEAYLFTFKNRKLIARLRAEPATGKVEQFTLYPFSD